MEKRPSHNLPEEELALIASYLSGEMPPDQLDAFERRLSEEPGFRSKVAEVKALLIGIREANLEEQLDAYHAEIGQSKERATVGRRLIPYRVGWVAASVALLVLAGIWWIWFSTPSSERLYHAYFVPDVGLPVEMGSADTLRYLFYDGMISYKEGAYNDALKKWRSVAKASGTTDTLQYYMGIAYMELGDMDRAKEQLMEVAGDRNASYHKEATWYLALCYLHTGQRKNAVSLLERIAGDERAQELLKQLH